MKLIAGVSWFYSKLVKKMPICHENKTESFLHLVFIMSLLLAHRWMTKYKSQIKNNSQCIVGTTEKMVHCILFLWSLIFAVNKNWVLKWLLMWWLVESYIILSLFHMLFHKMCDERNNTKCSGNRVIVVAITDTSKNTHTCVYRENADLYSYLHIHSFVVSHLFCFVYGFLRLLWDYLIWKLYKRFAFHVFVYCHHLPVCLKIL